MTELIGTDSGCFARNYDAFGITSPIYARHTGQVLIQGPLGFLPCARIFLEGVRQTSVPQSRVLRSVIDSSFIRCGAPSWRGSLLD